MQFRPLFDPSTLYLPDAPRQHRSAVGMTVAEASLWAHLQLATPSVIWVAQHQAGPCRVDFICFAAALVVEVDDPEHFKEKTQIHDAKRDRAFMDRGYRVVRYTNKACLKHPDDVAARINEEAIRRISDLRAPSKTPTSDGEYPQHRMRQSGPRAEQRSPTPSAIDVVASAVIAAAAASPTGEFGHPDMLRELGRVAGGDGVNERTARAYLAAVLNADSSHCARPLVRPVRRGVYRLSS